MLYCAEFKKIALATSIGFLVMGFLGFIVKLVHIPSQPTHSPSPRSWQPHSPSHDSLDGSLTFRPVLCCAVPVNNIIVGS